MRMTIAVACLLATGFCAAGCGVTVKHEVKPIYVTVDVNIRIQRELERFFEFEKERGELVDARKQGSGENGGN